MLQRICIFVVVLAALSASAARAATVYEQAPPVDWLTATLSDSLCSPCKSLSQTGSRVFASFALDQAVTLGGARFAVVNNVFGPLGDFSVSIWASPFDQAGPLFQTVVRAADYTSFTGSKGFINISLPAWAVGSGSYWLSVLGVDGSFFQWGGTPNAGDDVRYVNGALTMLTGTEPRHYNAFFALSGQPVATPIGGTLPLLLSALAGLFFVRRRPAA
jgi:hypothetical protein